MKLTFGPTEFDDATNGPLQVFSVSEDGVSLPDVYAFADQAALAAPEASDYTASPIVQIDGQDVEAYLNDFATLNGGNQDPDANYNSLFPNVPDLTGTSGAGLGLFSTMQWYQGNQTMLKFANGTFRSFAIYAGTLMDFSNVTDGQSFFDTFCTGHAPNAQKSGAASTNTTTTQLPVTTEVLYTPVATGTATPIPSAYPQPVTILSDSSVAGYFSDLDSDLAVISIPSYGPGVNVTIEFENVVRELLATAKAYNKKKLIIDLRGNPGKSTLHFRFCRRAVTDQLCFTTGGTVLLAFDTFRQLFPTLTPYGATNLRAIPVFNTIGESISSFWSNVTSDELLTNGPYSTEVGSAVGAWFNTPFNYREEVNSMYQDFTSWQNFFGPLPIHGDNFTSLARFNYSDLIQTDTIPIYGYVNDTAPQPQTFTAEDIVLLQDGACASTCTIFTELMKSQAGVKQIVVGGRKQNGPMQVSCPRVQAKLTTLTI